MGDAKIKAGEEAAHLLAYQTTAQQIDELISNCLAIGAESRPEQREALVAGALTAVVRFYATASRDEGQTIITRDLVVGLTPGLHRAAEEVAKFINLMDRIPLADPN